MTSLFLFRRIYGKKSQIYGLVRKKFDQDIFMASLLNRLIELEANRVVAEMRIERPKPKHP